ncbi:MAG TPA: heavy metal-binding domain-containing protein [Polyangiales bacterium]|nr:heavy metal-binding domain-containing protein [Polyangiales bacterium]
MPTSKSESAKPAAASTTSSSTSSRSGSVAETAGHKFTCPMHPEVITEHAGRCPKCNMELVPVAPTGAEAK